MPFKNGTGLSLIAQLAGEVEAGLKWQYFQLHVALSVMLTSCFSLLWTIRCCWLHRASCRRASLLAGLGSNSLLLILAYLLQAGVSSLESAAIHLA